MQIYASEFVYGQMIYNLKFVTLIFSLTIRGVMN